MTAKRYSAFKSKNPNSGWIFQHVDLFWQICHFTSVNICRVNPYKSIK